MRHTQANARARQLAQHHRTMYYVVYDPYDRAAQWYERYTPKIAHDTYPENPNITDEYDHRGHRTIRQTPILKEWQQ